MNEAGGNRISYCIHCWHAFQPTIASRIGNSACQTGQLPCS